jgi:hypothetical protein
MKVGFIFDWFDVWVGFYYNKTKHRLYFFPIPMFGMYFELEAK